jgi:hypothetical protein
MRLQSSRANNAYFIKDSVELEDSTTRIKRILEAKHEKANLRLIVEQCRHLNIEEKTSLKMLLRKYKFLMFDSTLGIWTGEAYHIELKPDVIPYHARPTLSVPRIHEQTLHKEVERLCKHGVLI